MTDWCLNRLKVWGNRRSVLSFHIRTVGSVNDEIGLFSQFRPLPQELNNRKMGNELRAESEEAFHRFHSLYGAADWYSWCMKNWGVKWDVHELFEASLSEGKRSCHMEFDTASSPPYRGIAAMKEQYPDLKFSLKFYTPSNGLRGCRQW